MTSGMMGYNLALVFTTHKLIDLWDMKIIEISHRSRMTVRDLMFLI